MEKAGKKPSGHVGVGIFQFYYPIAAARANL